ncbi:MAG: hypothetical protein ACRCTI_20485, partial [Beijerinckiaceae bacterium]
LSASYTRWRQALLIVNVAASFLIVIFADSVLSAWLGSGSSFAREVAAIMPIFIAGSMIGGAIVVPNALLYARGDFRLLYLASAAYIVLFVLVLAVARPADYRHYAYAWIAFNLISACVIVPRVRVSDEEPGFAKMLLEAAVVAISALVLLMLPSLFATSGLSGAADSAIKAASVLVVVLALLGVLPAGRAQIMDSLGFAARSLWGRMAR